MAHQYPDKTGGDEEKFKEINEAIRFWEISARSMTNSVHLLKAARPAAIP